VHVGDVSMISVLQQPKWNIYWTYCWHKVSIGHLYRSNLRRNEVRSNCGKAYIFITCCIALRTGKINFAYSNWNIWYQISCSVQLPVLYFSVFLNRSCSFVSAVNHHTSHCIRGSHRSKETYVWKCWFKCQNYFLFYSLHGDHLS
jgi:hypothetical protein